MQTTRSEGAITPSSRSNFGAGDAGRAGRFATNSACAHLGFGVEDLLVRNFANDPVHEVECAQALLQIHGAIDFDGAGDRVGFGFASVEFVVVIASDAIVGFAVVPAQAAAFVQLMEGVSAGGIDHCQARNAVDQAELMEFDKGLAESARVTEVAAGDHDPIGRLPTQGFEDAEHDGLLAFEAERIDAVDEVNAKVFGDFFHAQHGIIEVACDLNGERAVFERLRKLAEGDLAAADEDDRFHQTGHGAIHSERCGGVAGRSAGGSLRAG